MVSKLALYCTSFYYDNRFDLIDIYNIMKDSIELALNQKYNILKNSF